MTTEEDASDPFEKVAAREAQIEDYQKRRRTGYRGYYGYVGKQSSVGSVSFFVFLLLLLPLHWVIPSLPQWMLVTHIVIIAIAGGSAAGALVRRGQK
jgi:hypothetical protein